MPAVILAFSLSLDGYAAGPAVSRDNPMGGGGERLHDWLFGDDPTDARVAAELKARVGAVVLGRRTYEVGVELWEDTPYPAPSFVLTHERLPPQQMASAGFSFLDDLPAAIAEAKAAAGARDVIVMGVETGRQALRLKLVDELVVQTVPILLGAGSRLLDGLASPPRLTQLAGMTSSKATHLHYRVDHS